MDNDQTVAVVPIREGSSRIKDKNFVPFGKHTTLLENKIQHLKMPNVLIIYICQAIAKE